jgi:bifunctional enzyme CysN/CysC
MATAASQCDLAVLLVDARKGLIEQTRRHSYIAALFGIRHVALAINKMDLIEFDHDAFERMAADYRLYATQLGIASVTAIPVSARFGDNVVQRSDHTSWYQGPTLLQHLEEVTVADASSDTPFRFPIQSVSRPNADFRGYCGTVASGQLRTGDTIVVARSGERAEISKIVTFDGDLSDAVPGQAVTLTLSKEIDASRGDVLVATEKPPEVLDQMAAHIVWMGKEELLPGRRYLMKIGTKLVPAWVTGLKYKIDLATHGHLAATTLRMNDVGFVTLSSLEPIAIDPYKVCKETGGFILIDPFSNATVAAGMIAFGLRRGENVHRQEFVVNKQARAALQRQRPCVLWFTGLSGAGKSTIANLVEQKLHALGHATYLLDGDNIRLGINKDLGFTPADRVENVRRTAEVAKLMVDAGLIVLVSLIAPFEAERATARSLFEPGEFVEIYVNAPLELCQQRDPKGLYRKAREGKLINFTGIDSPYEPPRNPELELHTDRDSAETLARAVLAFLAPSAGKA